MKYIYVLSSCNAWKEWASRDIILVTTSIRKLRKEIKEQVKKGNMEIGNEYMFNDWLNGNYIGCSHESLDNILQYGMLEVWED